MDKNLKSKNTFFSYPNHKVIGGHFNLSITFVECEITKEILSVDSNDLYNKKILTEVSLGNRYRQCQK